ncbi:hypothetical protein EYC56_14250 [Xanthomonas oryzae]|nr:hypothetical protein EYC54_09820 [Xanthomonas oryzae]QBH00233.1 hypothetical protein EYC56_14250 [Xanthomonas oryzae]
MTPEKLMGHRCGWSGRFASGLVGSEGDYSIPAVGQRLGWWATTSRSCVVELADGRAHCVCGLGDASVTMWSRSLSLCECLIST